MTLKPRNAEMEYADQNNSEYGHFSCGVVFGEFLDNF